MPKILFISALGIAVIALGYLAFLTEAPAYIGSASETCGDCHNIGAPYENWYHGGHALWAKCTDCHLPHENIVAYYAEKGRQGVNDASAFVAGNIPDANRATKETKALIQENCIRCHKDTVETMLAGAQPFDRNCWDCHRSVAHGDRGASLAPYQDSSLYPTK